MDKRKVTGQRGEALAAAYLSDRGYTILHRNWRCPGGELDLIVEKEQTLIFVEVRSRSSRRFGTPEESITPAKQKRLIDLSYTFLQHEQPSHPYWRIDVVAIDLNTTPPTITHLENAVGWQQ